MRRYAVLIAISICLALLSQPANAWKPKTHVYVANVIMADALDNNKVWIPPFGEFDVDPQVLAAMRANPAQFRAGAVGPDGFPDMWTGQMYIHPGTDPWLQHLWRCLQEPDGPAGRAFVYGYFTHCAGDMWAHDWVNYYAGGVWPAFTEIAANPSAKLPIIARHLAVETTLDKRVPVGQRTIDIPNDFVYSKMLLHPGAKTAGMNPLIQHYVDLYWQKYPKKDETIAGIKTYDANWWADLDEGLRNWVAANETALKQAVETDDTNLISALATNLGPWALVHILDMEGAPSATKAMAGVLVTLSGAVKAALHAMGLDAIVETMQQQFVDWMCKTFTKMDEQTLRSYMLGEVNSTLFPSNLNQIMSDIGAIPAESAWVHSNTDHARFQQFINTVNGPLYNSVITGKIAILAPTAYGNLTGTYAPQPGANVLLGQLKCIDGSKQFCAATDGGLRNMLGYGTLSSTPNARPAFPYVFKPYTPINDTDKTTLWMQRGTDNKWKNGYRVFMDAKVTDPGNPTSALGAPGAMLLWRPAASRTGPWNVISMSGNLRTQMAVELGKQYTFRPLHSGMNFSGSSTFSFTTPVDLRPELKFTGTPVTRGVFTAANSAVTIGTLGSAPPDLVSPNSTGLDKAAKVSYIYQDTKPDTDKTWYTLPTDRAASLQYELTAIPTGPFGITGNTLGLPNSFMFSITKCRLVKAANLRLQDMWLAGVKGTLKVKSGAYSILPPNPAAMNFVIDVNGSVVWGCNSFQEAYRTGRSMPNMVVVDVGSHPGILHLDLELKPDMNSEFGARMAYAYRKVQPALDAVPSTTKATPPYQALQSVLNNLQGAVVDPVKGETDLRTAINNIPDQQPKASLTQALNTALIDFPNPEGQTNFKVSVPNIGKTGEIQGSLGSYAYWPALCSAFDIFVFPNIDGPDSEAVPPNFTLKSGLVSGPVNITRPQGPGTPSLPGR